MLFITHAVAGGVLAQASGNPEIGFVGAFGLHHILDYVPHCDPGSFKTKSTIPGTLTKEQTIMAVADVVLGVALVSYLYLHFHLGIVFLSGVVGGVLPDILGVTPRISSYWHQTKIGHPHGLFHQKWHTTLPWKYAWFGIGIQVVVIALSVLYLQRGL